MSADHDVTLGNRFHQRGRRGCGRNPAVSTAVKTAVNANDRIRVISLTPAEEAGLIDTFMLSSPSDHVMTTFVKGEKKSVINERVAQETS